MIRKFRVRLTATALLERFVTVEVEDGPNAEMLAQAMVGDVAEARKPGERWTVAGASLDRFDDVESVIVPDPVVLHSQPSLGGVEEVKPGVEVVRVDAKGSRVVAFFAEDPADADAATIEAERECGAQRTTHRNHPGVAFFVRDTF